MRGADAVYAARRETCSIAKWRGAAKKTAASVIGVEKGFVPIRHDVCVCVIDAIGVLQVMPASSAKNNNVSGHRCLLAVVFSCCGVEWACLMLVTTVEGVPVDAYRGLIGSVDVEAEKNVERSGACLVHAERRLDDFVYEEAIDAFTHTGYNGGLGYRRPMRCVSEQR